MPLRKDGSGRRWIEVEYVVPGTPERVWHAMATGPGISSWFAPATVEEEVGGALEFDFGAGTSRGVVTGWEPPARFVYEERDWSGEAPALATEVTITSRSGDRCVVRMVHSLFTSRDDWDDEMESFESGWPGFFAVLRVYLRDFASQPTASLSAVAVSDGTVSDAWAKVTGALGVAGANYGDRIESPSGTPVLTGVVERIHQADTHREVMLRTSKPTTGVAVVGCCSVGTQSHAAVTLFLYGADATQIAAAEREAWSSWLKDVLA